MFVRFILFALAALGVINICFAIAQEADTLNWDWWSESTDYPYNDDSNQLSASLQDPDTQNQGESIQSNLFGPSDLLYSDTNPLEKLESMGLDNPNLFDSIDPNAPMPDLDNSIALDDTDSFTSGCSSDGTARISKRKKGEECRANYKNPSSSRTKEPECKPESEICPMSKTAMCCIGAKEAWERWSGFSVGGCIKCMFFLRPRTPFIVGRLVPNAAF